MTGRKASLSLGIVLWTCWFLVARLLQLLLGAPDNPFSGYPDSPAHYVSGLLVWNYLLAGLPADPLAFAQDFYLHYPMVGIGHWPPGYHLAQAVWGIVFSPAPSSILWLQAVAMASACTLACRILSYEIGWLGAVVASTVFLVSPPAQLVVSGIMAEPLTAALCLGAAAAYVSYLDRPRPLAALIFGVLAGMALLTKGAAISLALLPLSALLCGRAALPRRWDFWAPAAVVAALAGPWYFGIQHLPGLGAGFRYSAEYTLQRRSLEWRGPIELLHRAQDGLAALGWGLAGLALLGFVVCFLVPAWRKSLTPRAAVIGTFVAASAACHFVLRDSNEPRHLLHALPFAMGFAVAGAQWSVERAAGTRSRRFRVAAAAVVCILAVGGARLRKPPARGLDRAAEAIRADPELDEAVLLVSSRAGGEAIFVAEAAALEPRPRRVVLRAAKVLADSGWAARRYALRYQSASEAADYLDSIPVGVLVIDTAVGDARVTHHQQLLDALALHPDRWRPVELGGGPVRVFRSTRSDLKQRAPIRIDLTRRLGNILELPPKPSGASEP